MKSRLIVCKPMNKNHIYETVLLGERKVHRPADGVCSGHSLDVPADMIARQLIWSSRRPDDWEILVYKQNEGWEACFFRWPIHHEHVSGPSFNSVLQIAEQRIHVLEARRLKTTKWPQTINHDGTVGLQNKFE